jgi:release factor glutamine methyltransferase
VTAASSPSLRDLLSEGVARLRDAGSASPELDAALLLGHAMNLSRTSLYAHLPEAAPPAGIDAFHALVDRRVRGEPVAYLLGYKSFYDLTFAVTPDVLVPRPETELLVEWAAGWLNRRRRTARVVDVGTGSGAIGVTVAHLVPGAEVTGVDISRRAAMLARGNAETAGVLGHAGFVVGDLLRWLGSPVDLILANLPYLSDAQAESPDLRAEPALALVGGDHDGFGLYRELISQVAARLAPDGAFAFEIDPSQAGTAMAAVRDAWPTADASIHHDLAGHARFVTVCLDH